MSDRSTGRDSDKFMLRLPDGMRDRIKAAADVNKRSMNAEIVGTLDLFYPTEPSDEELLEQVERSLQLWKGGAQPYKLALFHALTELGARLRVGASKRD